MLFYLPHMKGATMSFLNRKVNQKVDDAVDRSTTRVADKVKTHFRDNKRTYFAFGAGALLVFVAGGRRDVEVNSNTKYLSINSPDNSTNVVVTQLARRGHPGNLVRCNETGEVFASQNRAAEFMNLSKGNLSQHLAGKQDSVNGFTFDKIGEAQ